MFYRGELAQFSARGLLLRPFSEKLWGVAVAAFVVFLLATILTTHSVHLLAENFGAKSNKCTEQASCIFMTGVILCQGSLDIPYCPCSSEKLTIKLLTQVATSAPRNRPVAL